MTRIERTTVTVTETITEGCCETGIKTVVGNCINNVITLPCPFTENQISDKLAHISVYKQIYTPQSPNAAVSIDSVKVLKVSRSLGLNPSYCIEVENTEDGNYQVVFAAASFVPHEPPMGHGGPQIVGDIG